MGITARGEGRIRVIGFDNYGKNVFIVAWKKTSYPSETIVTKVACKTEVGTSTVTLDEPVYSFSCHILYPYIVYTYNNGTRNLGSATERKVTVVDIGTGSTATFNKDDLDIQDVTPENYPRWKMLAGIGIIKQSSTKVTEV